jgi:hypothetical protein
MRSTPRLLTLLLVALLIVPLALGGFALAVAPPVDPAVDLARDIIPVLLAGLVSVVTAAIGWAATRAAAWFEARARESKGSTLSNAIALAYTVAGPTVQHLAQTVVDKLRAASADGRLDPRDAAAVMEAAIQEVWAGLGKNVRDTLVDQYGSLEGVIGALIRPAIEAKVREINTTAPSTTPPVQNDAQALRELQHARERLRAMTAGAQ